MAIDMDRLQDEIYDFWKMKKGANGHAKEETNIALPFGTFFEKCNKCKQKGHKAKDCPKKGNGGSHNKGGGNHNKNENNGNTKFYDGIKCYNCNEIGHYSSS